MSHHLRNGEVKSRESSQFSSHFFSYATQQMHIESVASCRVESPRTRSLAASMPHVAETCVRSQVKLVVTAPIRDKRGTSQTRMGLICDKA